MRSFLYPPSLLLTTLLSAQFSAPRMIDHTAVDRPYDIEVGDLDSDGDTDVVTVTLGYDSGPIWFPNRGDGTFLPRRPMVDQSSYTDFQLVDLDLDGDLDILGISNYPGELGWYENDGAGNFGPNQLISDLVPEGKDVYAADLDGDGDMDVLSASYGNDKIAWYRNLGNMVFGPQLTLVTVPGAYTVRAADMDGDGDMDVLTGGQGASTQAWYRNNGSGVFTAVPVADPGYGGFGTMEVCDVNGDAFPDVVGQTTGAGWTRWYANDGTGELAAGVTMMVGSQPVDFAMDDLDADGDLDLMVCDGLRIRWWTNDGAGNFSDPVFLVNGYDAWGVDAGDLNGDGITDVVGCSYDDSHMMVVQGMGGGDFAPVRIIGAEPDAFRSIITADVNGDGKIEVVVAVENEDKVAWFASLPDGNWDNEHAVTTLAVGASCVRAADLDGDGDMDLLSAGSYAGSTGHIAWYANDGAGNFGPQQLLTSGFNHGRMLEVGDMDGDGDVDIVGGSTTQTKVFTNDGAGNFDAGTLIAAGTPRRLALADLDADGDLDVMVGILSVSVYLNEGGGVYTPGFTFTTSPNEVLGVTALDMDDDGDLDLAWYRAGGNGLDWRANNGDGTFATDLQGIALDFNVTHFTTGDIDGDGRKDVLFSKGHEVRWNRHLGAGQWMMQPAIPNVTGSARTLHLGDVDGDGDLDVITGSATEGKLAWHESYFLSPSGFQGMVFQDLDGDGLRTPEEPGVSWLPVQVTPSIPGLFSLENGTYMANVELGTYGVSTNAPPALWALTTPDPQTVELTATTPVVTGIDVGITALVDTTILIPSVTLAPAVCGANTTLWVSVANAGTRIEQCDLRLSIHPTFTFVSSTPPPTSISGNLLEWTLDPLPFFGTVTIPIVVTMPTVDFLDTPFLHVASVTNYDAQGQLLGEYSGKLLDTLACSYDPNDKLIDPPGYGIFGAVELSSDTLDYTIRFQNTGNAPAVTVMLSDQLDPILDPERIQLLGHSHPISLMRVEADGELVVRFDDIQLPGAETDLTGSQGFVRFRIKPDEGAVQHLSTAHNTAGIYFDLNEPVITNTTLTTWVDCDLWQPELTLFGVDSLVATPGDAYQWFRNDEPIDGANDASYEPTSSGTYTAEVTSGYGCMRLTGPIAVIGTGMGSLSQHTVIVRPNPFTAATQLVFAEALTSQDRIELIDTQGRLLHSWNGNGSNQLLVQRGDLKAGVYVVQLMRDGQRTAVVRVVAE